MNSKTWMNWIRPAALAAFAVLPGMACSYSMSVGRHSRKRAGWWRWESTLRRDATWQVTKTAAWLSNYSGWAGRGPGTALFYAQPNSAHTARAVTLHVIAGVPFGLHRLYHGAILGLRHDVHRGHHFDEPIRPVTTFRRDSCPNLVCKCFVFMFGVGTWVARSAFHHDKSRLGDRH